MIEKDYRTGYQDWDIWKVQIPISWKMQSGVWKMEMITERKVLSEHWLQI